MSTGQSFIEKYIKELKTIGKVLPGVEQELKARGDEPELSLTTLPQFNRKLWGLKHGLTVLGGRTSMGKSALALQMAYDLADKQKEVLFLSLEMSVESMVERLFCNVMEVDNYDMLTGKLKTSEVYQQKWKTFDGLMRIPLILSCGIGKTFSEINESLQLLNPKPKVIIIDYIQAIKANKNEREDMNEYIRLFREVCIKNKIAGVLCSQVSRAVFEDGNKEPSLANLKGTGCIHPDSIVEGQPIKEIVDNKIDMYLSSYDIEKKQEVKVKPSRYVHTGKKRCLKIRTKSGKVIILSNDTELFDGTVWKKAKNYITGEKILVDIE